MLELQKHLPVKPTYCNDYVNYSRRKGVKSTVYRLKTVVLAVCTVEEKESRLLYTG